MIRNIIMKGEISMKKSSIISLSLFTVLLLSCCFGCKQEEKHPQVSKQAASPSTQAEMGEKLFHEHCVMCHSDGHRMKDIGSPDAIVHTMRNPKNSMPKFTDKEIPDVAAEAIAKYVFFSVLLKK
jgi:mono/diheme cytochrome c family protein